MKYPSSWLMRWKLLLGEYDYEIQYRARNNCSADSLSRHLIHCLSVSVEDLMKKGSKELSQKCIIVPQEVIKEFTGPWSGQE
jgi:hypothetical protein